MSEEQDPYNIILDLVNLVAHPSVYNKVKDTIVAAGRDYLDEEIRKAIEEENKPVENDKNVPLEVYKHCRAWLDSNEVKLPSDLQHISKDNYRLLLAELTELILPDTRTVMEKTVAELVCLLGEGGWIDHIEEWATEEKQEFHKIIQTILEESLVAKP